MNVVKKQPMKSQIYSLIKSRILAQEYEIGSKLNIARLSKEFLVSNTPIREALSMLEQDGLISFSPNYGYTVFSLSDEKIKELEEFMTVLIIGSYEVCLAKGKTDELIILLEDCLKAQENAIESGDLMDITKTSLNFDQAFISILDNSTIYRNNQSIFYQIFLLVLYSHNHGSSEVSKKLTEHQEILKAVKEARHDDVSRLISTHFDRKVHITI